MADMKRTFRKWKLHPERIAVSEVIRMTSGITVKIMYGQVKSATIGHPPRIPHMCLE